MYRILSQLYESRANFPITLTRKYACHVSLVGMLRRLNQEGCMEAKGSAANTTSWATNIGNEWGEVVIYVLTESESVKSLGKMAEGLARNHRLSCTQTGTVAVRTGSLSSV